MSGTTSPARYVLQNLEGALGDLSLYHDTIPKDVECYLASVNEGDVTTAIQDPRTIVNVQRIVAGDPSRGSIAVQDHSPPAGNFIQVNSFVRSSRF